MKENATNNLSLRQLVVRLGAWIHAVIEKKGVHIDACGWYPGPCNTESPF